MDIWRSAGVFPVAKRLKEMRAQSLLNARQPANGHRRVLAVSHFFQSICQLINNYLNVKIQIKYVVFICSI